MLTTSYFLMQAYAMSFFFFFNDTATTEIYTLSLHDALPISIIIAAVIVVTTLQAIIGSQEELLWPENVVCRSEEHTSELQSRPHLVCRLLLEKKKKTQEGNAAAANHPQPELEH